MNMRAIVGVFAVTALVCSASAHAANVAAGLEKAKQICQACHGLDGNSPTADYPKLAGQYPEYLAKALRDYKSGQRKNPIMAPMAATLTPQDIDNLAAYYSGLPPVLQSKY